MSHELRQSEHPFEIGFGHLEQGSLSVSTAQSEETLQNIASAQYKLASEPASAALLSHHATSLRTFSHPQAYDLPASGHNNDRDTQAFAPDSVSRDFMGLTSYSPVSHQTPDLVLTEPETQSEEEEQLSSTASENGGDAADLGSPATKAETLAEKRKMKRFRLTHAQTRYLTSEFARQAHPDAGHRERLSHEIPGLSPRQVQVWFQNRRAKLKRLTMDDQESMTRSRAAPQDFDFTQSLQGDLREQKTPPEPISALHSLNLTGSRPEREPSLTTGASQRNVPQNSIASPYSNTTHGPDSLRGLANLSPVSSINDGSQYSGYCYSSSRSALPTSSFSTNPVSQMNRLPTALQAHQSQAQLSRQRSMTWLNAQAMVLSETSPSTSFPGNPLLQGVYEARSQQQRPYWSQGIPDISQSSESAGLMQQCPGEGQESSRLDSAHTLLAGRQQPDFPSTIGYITTDTRGFSNWQADQVTPLGYHQAHSLQVPPDSLVHSGAHVDSTPFEQNRNISSSYQTASAQQDVYRPHPEHGFQIFPESVNQGASSPPNPQERTERNRRESDTTYLSFH